jgi:hypothetical protein
MLLGAWFATGCLPGDPCAIDELRCEGGVLERCTAHPGGVYGPIESPHHVSGSGPDWENVADCGANLCVAPSPHEVFCALESAPAAVCSGALFTACDGQAQVTCRTGYVVERRSCAACDAASGACHAGTGDGCAGASCGGGLVCNADPYPTCEQPCDCPEGTACPACGDSWTQAPDGGATLTWTCVAHLCSFSY